MVVVEAAYWPLVVVGAIPDAPEAPAGSPPREEQGLWCRGEMRLAIVIAGGHTRAWIAQEEVFEWLSRHRERLRRCVSRVAWIFEDELMRRNAERWLALCGDRPFRGEMTTFCSVRSALLWLETVGLSRPSDL